jgi:drug/metabolite transporter (DMT)-like permease
MPFFRKFSPYFALGSGVLALSLSSLFIRWANAPGTITSFFRMTLAAVILTPICLHRNKVWIKPDWKIVLFPLLAGLFTALDHAVWSTSIQMTKVANATLMNNLAPVWVALIAVVFWREKLDWRFWLGLGLTMAGAGVVLGNDLIANPHLTAGDLLGILSSFFYAGYFLVTQRGRKHFDTLTYIWAVAIVCAAFLLVINLGLGRALAGYSLNTYLVFLAAALVSQIVGYFSVTYALGHLPAAVVSPTMIAQPVLTALLAIPFLGEALQPGQWLGGLAVLAGIYLVNRSHKADSQI